MFRRDKNERTPDGPVTEDAIRAWMVDYLVNRLSVEPAAVDTSRSFEDYGLDSRAGIQMCGKLEKFVELRLSPALLYEHSSIDAVAAHLGRRLVEESSH
ncbi:acyl carrier protein [Streptomyces sp. NBC_00582]|uniref:acyl carrier protein n=1 Tax=Streptomyces sp. NBC_00582 TaxID=2975783 RepID=UPI00106363B1|nr:acyl carrier protein [Streptomyces sp. NBC_00582]WUB66925.1 acyl carrier protein [Streptomyces sp. NBC_00582]